MEADEEKSGFARITLGAAVTGLVMGILYHFLTRYLQEAIIASEELRGGFILFDFHPRGVSAPFYLFAIASALFGWTSAWIAARVSGLSGAVLWIPVGITLLVAVAVGFVLNAAFLPALPNSTWIIFLVSAVAYACLAGFRMRFED